MTEDPTQNWKQKGDFLWTQLTNATSYSSVSSSFKIWKHVRLCGHWTKFPFDLFITADEAFHDRFIN